MGPNCLQPFIFTLSPRRNKPLLPKRPFSAHDPVVQVMTWRGWITWERLDADEWVGDESAKVAERAAAAIWSRDGLPSDCNRSCRSHHCYCQWLLTLLPFINFITAICGVGIGYWFIGFSEIGLEDSNFKVETYCNNWNDKNTFFVLVECSNQINLYLNLVSFSYTIKPL